MTYLQIGYIAQSVEQWPFKPTVAGSIPAVPTFSEKGFLSGSLLIFPIIRLKEEGT